MKALRAAATLLALTLAFAAGAAAGQPMASPHGSSGHDGQCPEQAAKTAAQPAQDCCGDTCPCIDLCSASALPGACLLFSPAQPEPSPAGERRAALQPVYKARRPPDPAGDRS